MSSKEQMMIDHADVMVIGIGDLGGWVVELLPRLYGMEHRKIVIAGKNEELVRKKTFSAWAGTSFLGLCPEMEFVSVDLLNMDQTGDLLRRYHPRVVCSCAALQPWWIVSEISQDVWSKIERGAGFGPWSPLHLTLIHKLMLTIRQYEIDTLVVNTSYPDLTNAVLGRVGLAPTCGAGNGDLVLPGVRRGVAKKLSIPAHDVAVYPVIHHSHVIQFMRVGQSGSPYYLKIMVADKDVTNEFNTDELILAGIEDWLPGRDSHPVTAASTVKNIWHLLFDTGELSFTPGPNGETGGYPVRMSARGVEITLPEGMTMDRARKINNDAQRYDGVERIEADGAIVFTDAAYSAMRDTVGYDCKVMKLEESEERSKELLARYGELKKRYGRR